VGLCDGNYATGRTTAHRYAKAGHYTVTLEEVLSDPPADDDQTEEQDEDVGPSVEDAGYDQALEQSEPVEEPIEAPEPGARDALRDFHAPDPEELVEEPPLASPEWDGKVAQPPDELPPEPPTERPTTLAELVRVLQDPAWQAIVPGPPDLGPLIPSCGTRGDTASSSSTFEHAARSSRGS
jgi:hypothetical protein